MKVLIAHKHKPLERVLEESGIGYVSAKRDRELIAKEIKDANVFIADKQVPPTREELESAKNLQLIHAGTGYDFLNKEFNGIEYATEHGIAVASTPSVVARAVAEHTFSLIHKILGLGAVMDAETFDKGPERMELCESTFGSIGYGDIGYTVCGIAKGYGMKIIVNRLHPEKGLGKYENDPEVRNVVLPVLLQSSDIVSLHVPETADTKGVIGYEEFEQMKPSAYLINTARGRIVDEMALVRALDEGLIAGAGIDVYSKEPLSKDPDLNREFMRLVKERKMVCTPHMASNSIKGEERRAMFYYSNITRLKNGEPLEAVVNPGYIQHYNKGSV